jgi:hypothetical protein
MGRAIAAPPPCVYAAVSEFPSALVVASCNASEGAAVGAPQQFTGLLWAKEDQSA